MLCMKDGRGKKSKTLFFVSISWVVLVLKFLFAGVTLMTLGQIPPMTASEFGMAVAMILGIWLGREYTDKKSETRAAD